MSGELVEKDHGWDRIMKTVHRAAADQPHVKVGIQGDKASAIHAGAGPEIEYGSEGEALPMQDSGLAPVLSIVEIAAVHEFGTLDGRIPERSFIRATIEENAQMYHDLAKALHISVIDGKRTVDDALRVFGARVCADMKRRIQAGLEPPLADSTIRRKHSSKPLIDTGQLLNALTWEVA